MAEAEWLDGQVDGCRVGDVELVLHSADTPVIFQKEAAFHKTVIPTLEKWKIFLF